jgi:hypothetical protein
MEIEGLAVAGCDARQPQPRGILLIKYVQGVFGNVIGEVKLWKYFPTSSFEPSNPR